MSLSQLKAVPCSVEDGKDRYPRKTETKAPEFAPWRNNLTVLSQYYNLLFVAQVDKIHVFQPLFPTQKVGRKLLCVIDLPVSQHAQPGYIDRFKPHAVNHLIVGDLGIEEILLVACDDGDIIGYRTRSVANPFKYRIPEGSDPILDYQPFFHENIGYSAWGLAIHTGARLIAISSNSHRIHVFAFALYSGEESGNTTPLSNSREYEDLDFNWARPIAYGFGDFFPRWKQSEDPLLDRKYINVVFALQEHQNNIPNIAFYNPGCVADNANSSVFLASIDIDDQLVIWDVWKGVPYLSTQRHWPNTRARGWSVALLENSTAQITQTTLESFGLLFPVDLGSKFMDISSHIQRIPDNSSQHPAFAKFSIVPSAPIPVAAPGETEEISEGDEEDHEAGESQESDSDVDVQGVVQNLTAAQSADHGTHMLLQPGPSFTSTHQMHPESDSEDENDLSQNPRTISSPNSPKPFTTPISLAQNLPFNILLTSEKDIRLLSNISPSAISNSCICESAVSQTMPPGLQHLKHIERLNMVHQIPEIGVVAVANQAGRVALLTMTFYQPQQQPAFKMEAILPFKSQEEQDLRPEYQLVGMAISPVQGQQARAPCEEAFAPFSPSPPLRRERGTRRWRLLMTYMNHTILSYEISRPNGDVEILAI